jgi:hypothetical protein
MLDDLAKEIRDFEGVRRKRVIEPFVRSFHHHKDEILASFGEDAAVIDRGGDDDIILLAADGIWSKLMEADPVWAGYCSVLVNILDIAAMGGIPLAMVDVFSVSSNKVCMDVAKGISEAVDKFGVPIVGGHMHPDTDYDSLDIAIIGTARKECVIFSNTAQRDDDIIVGIDLAGRVHPSCDLNWDSTSFRDKRTLWVQLDAMRDLGEKKLVTAGKDISNPGLIGTIGTMLEVSRKGAIVNVDAISIPSGIILDRWLKVYPGMGFVVTSNPINTEEVRSIFQQHELSSMIIGKVTDGKTLTITDGNSKAEVFDFEVDYITGLGKGDM